MISSAKHITQLMSAGDKWPNLTLKFEPWNIPFINDIHQ